MFEYKSVQLQQVDSLSSHGLVVKNTFIDGPPQWWGNIPRRRAHSAFAAVRPIDEQKQQPPQMANCAFSTPAFESWVGTSRHKSVECCAEKYQQSTLSFLGDVSTACSETDEYNFIEDDCRQSDNYFSNLTCEQSARQIVELVEHECSFLRIHGHSIPDERTKRKPWHDVTATFAFTWRACPWQDVLDGISRCGGLLWPCCKGIVVLCKWRVVNCTCTPRKVWSCVQSITSAKWKTYVNCIALRGNLFQYAISMHVL